MNLQLQLFINEKKAEQKRKRDEHLISLGLIDENKTTKKIKYYEYLVEGARLDSEKQLWYVEVEEPAPIDITDEEYEELLKYTSITTSTTQQEKNIKTPYADTINAISVIFLILSILVIFYSFILFANGENGWVLFTTGIVCCLSYPFYCGFSKIVAMAETYLQKQDK